MLHQLLTGYRYGTTGVSNHSHPFSPVNIRTVSGLPRGIEIYADGLDPQVFSSPSVFKSTPEMLETQTTAFAGDGNESIMKSAKLQQKRRTAGRKPPPSTRRQGKPKADQVQKRPAPSGYQISVRYRFLYAYRRLCR